MSAVKKKFRCSFGLLSWGEDLEHYNSASCIHSPRLSSTVFSMKRPSLLSQSFHLCPQFVKHGSFNQSPWAKQLPRTFSRLLLLLRLLTWLLSSSFGFTSRNDHGESHKYSPSITRHVVSFPFVITQGCQLRHSATLRVFAFFTFPTIFTFRITNRFSSRFSNFH